MDLPDYIAGIRFRLIQPDTPRPVVTLPYPTVNYYRQNLFMEMDNAALPADQDVLRRRILSVWHLPRLSTFVNGAIINRVVSRMKPGHAFVNAGAFNSFTLNPFHFLAGITQNPDKLCIGVDHFARFGHSAEPFLAYFNSFKSGNHHFFDMDYAEYFTHQHSTPIGCYLFDGVPDYHCQVSGLQLAEPFFTDGCIILAANVNWPETRQAMHDFVQYSAGGYRILLDRQTNGNCHPTFWNGLMVLQTID